MSNEPVVYTAPPTISDFFKSDAMVRLIVGPFGSGKSSGCTMEILRRATLQAPARDGMRRTRFAIIRNSYRELEDTTRKTVEDWIPSDIRIWSESDAKMTIRFNDVECELLFRALDRPEDAKKLLSLELTGAWINEAKEIPRAIFDALTGRIGRYPSSRHGGPTWSGIWMDTNPPDSDHWIFRVFEEQKPPEFKVFHQPSGLDPLAENVEHLPQSYYPRMMVGKTKEWIDVFVHGKYGFVTSGRPVFPEYKDELHTSQSPLEWLGGDVTLGMDFGLTPAIVVGQRTPYTQWQILEEFISDDMGATTFSQYVASELKRNYPGAKVQGWGDPAGTQRSQVDERTPYDVVRAAGLPIDPAFTNDFVRRREAVANALTKLTMNGTPRLIVSPKCRQLRKAMAGGYAFKRLQVSGEERFRDMPDKSHFSHVADALQYLMVGEGEDSTAVTSRDTSGQRFRVKPAAPLERLHGPNRNRPAR